MKGGLAVFVYALLALRDAGMDHAIPLTLILNSDEEIGSPTSRSLYEMERHNASACFVAECAGLKGEIVVSRNGKMGVRIDSSGQDRHVGFGTHEKASAILELAHKIVRLEDLNASLPGVSVNVGQVEGGLGPCTIPGKAHCLVDVRWVDGSHQVALEERIDAIVAEPDQDGCTSGWEILNQRPAMPLTQASGRLYERVRSVAVSLDQEVGKEHRRGTSDANFFGSQGIPTLDGWGPVCDRDHTPEEWILLPSLRERTVLLACLLADYPSWAGSVLTE
jgi:glutamate carboxypeptidase